MALSTVAGITSAIAAGQYYKTSWTKTFGAAAAIGYWYNTFLMAGQPPAGSYGSTMTATPMYGSSSIGPSLTNSGGNWTVTVATNVVTVDTISDHGYISGNIIQTNTGASAWSTNTFMKNIVFTILSAPTTHTFTFSLTQGNQGTVTEAGTSSSTTLCYYTPTTGRISCAENVFPLVKHLVNIEVVTATASAAPAWLMLVDFLMNYSGVDLSNGGVQTFNNAPGGTPVGLPRYTDGKGVMMFLDQTIAGTASIPITQLTYTDEGGNSGTVPPAYLAGYTAIPASTPVQRISHSGIAQNNFGPFLPLAAGDQGVRSATNIQFGSTTTGTACMILCKPLATIPLITSAAGNVAAVTRDYIFNMPSLPRIYDGACLGFLYYAGGAATPVLYGTLDFVWG